jgi:hypothetical protein
MNDLICKIACVYDTNDPTGAGRIRVRLSQDFNIPDDELDWCSPLLPKHLYIIPKRGEYVLLFTDEVGNFRKKTKRFYIGPLISNLNHIDQEPSLSAKIPFEGSLISPEINPENDPNTRGAFPTFNKETEKYDIGILGRDNTDILFKNNEVWVRAGHLIDTNIQTKIFSERPTFVKLKNHKTTETHRLKVPDTKDEVPIIRQYRTTATVVADEINLISSAKDATPPFEVADRDNMISDNEMRKILETAHRLPYGDILCDFLEKLKTLVLNHTHDPALEKPLNDQDGFLEAVSSFNVEDILSKNIRIN